MLEAAFAAHASGEAEPREDWELLDRRRQEVARDGIEATVRARVPALVEGPGSQLFHPVIRLAYALDVGHPGQVAAALADWEDRHQVLPVPMPAAGSVSAPASMSAPGSGSVLGSAPGSVAAAGSRRLTDVAADLAGQPPGTWDRTFDLDGSAHNPVFAGALAGVALDEHTLDDVSSFAVAAHTVADDFITLHLVTGARAVRAVSAHLDGDTAMQLAAHTLPVVAVAYAAVGAPPLVGEAELDVLRQAPMPTREAIAERAIADRDPHVIKLANVALVEEQRTGDLLYRRPAARVVRLPVASAADA